jgi:hypothetical protein
MVADVFEMSTFSTFEPFKGYETKSSNPLSLVIADAGCIQCHLTVGLPYGQALHQKGNRRPDAQWGTIMDCLGIKCGSVWHGW